MPRFYFGKAFSLMAKTLPCVLAIMAANAVFGLVVVVYYIVLFGVLAIMPKGLELLSFVIFVVGLGGNFALFKAFKHYFLYLLRAGHIAVMAEFLSAGKLPAGTSQISFGKTQVVDRFKSVSGMFVVGELVQGVVGAITNMMGGLLSFFPGDTLKQLGKIVAAVIKTASSYIDEAILARAFIQKDKNIFEVGKDGTILYAMAWKPILANAAGLAVLSWASMAIFIVLFVPVGYVMASVLPSSLDWVATVSVIAFAYLSKVSLGDTFAVATTIAAFHEETKNMVPSAEWNAKLTSASDKFRELSKRATEKFTGAPTATPAAAPTHVAMAAAELPPLPNMMGTVPPIPVQ